MKNSKCKISELRCYYKAVAQNDKHNISEAYPSCEPWLVGGGTVLKLSICFDLVQSAPDIEIFNIFGRNGGWYHSHFACEIYRIQSIYRTVGISHDSKSRPKGINSVVGATMQRKTSSLLFIIHQRKRFQYSLFIKCRKP